MPEFVFFMRADASSEAGGQHPKEAFEAMTKYNEELNAAGVLLSGEALAPTKSDSYHLKFDGSGNADVTSGPFDVGADNHVTGWWVVKTNTVDEALALAKKVPAPNCQVYVRRIVEGSDLGPGYTGDIAERDAKVRKDAGDRARDAGK